MNNKIGIITFHRTTNFGSMLQTYGLYKKINDLGYQGEIIDYRCPAIEKREGLIKDRKKVGIKALAKKILIQPTLDKKAKFLKKFADENMHISAVYTPESVEQSDSLYSKFFAGSDIVWGRDITNHDYAYFLNFVSDSKKKYSYASSVGDYVSYWDDKVVGDLLADFSHITVRETDAVEWVRQKAGRKAELVCDPTMLLTTEEWEKFTIAPKKERSYVLVYYDSDNSKCLQDAIGYANRYNLKVKYINYGIPEKKVLNVKPTSVPEFLSLIKYADYVFTASYHGMLFSLYFEKQFCFYTRARRSRLLSLAERLGVSDRYCDQVVEMPDSVIDYNDVNARIDDFRSSSIEILKNMLEESNE